VKPADDHRNPPTVLFNEVFEVISDGGLRLAQRDYLPEGGLPVVDQGETFIGGYCDDPALAYSGPLPVLVFGDHTRRVKLVEFKFVVGADGTKLLRPLDGFDPRFAYYHLLATELRNRGYARHMSELRKARFWRPELSEQRKVVESLEEQFSRLDAVLRAVEQCRSRTSQLRRSVLQTLLDPPAESMEDTTCWMRTTLGEVAKFLNGRAYKREELLEDGKYRVLRVGNFFSNKGWYWSDLELDDDKYCDHGDLLYAWSASFGPRIWEGEKVIFHYHIWKVVEAPQIVTKSWLRYWLEHDVDRIKAAHGTGTTMVHVTKRDMERRQISVPPLEHQALTVDALERLTSRIDAVFGLLDRLEAKAVGLRRSLLHAAFTGELTKKWREQHHG
jgi:hypothetical protein